MLAPVITVFHGSKLKAIINDGAVRIVPDPAAYVVTALLGSYSAIMTLILAIDFANDLQERLFVLGFTVVSSC